MYVTETYKDFWEILALVPDKTSILLQRFYYYYKTIGLESSELAILNKVKKGLEKESMEFANLEAICSYGK